MKIEFDKSQFDEAVQAIDRFAGKKSAQKILNALNRAGFDTRKAMVADMPRIFDNPNEFVKNSLYFNQARLDGDNVTGGFLAFKKKSIGVGAGIFLLPEEFGGSRAFNGFERRLKNMGILPEGMFAVPTKAMPKQARRPATLQKLANDLGKQITRVDAGKQSRAKYNDYFVITPTGGRNNRKPGIYLRQGNQAVQLFAFVDSVKYKAIFEFYKRAAKYFGEIFFNKIRDELSKG
jgi:hypothetical protein